jgi:hypothetical protein
MKKGSYWFSKLSDSEQVMFKQNCRLQSIDFDVLINKKFQSFADFIDSFIWIDTMEGGRYWVKIWQRNII